MEAKEGNNKNRRKMLPVKQDPLKITFKRGNKQETETSNKKTSILAKALRNKSKVKLFRCISMWKNPTSQIVSLETRMIHDRFKDVQQEINTEMFLKLKSSLDDAEYLHSQSNDTKCAVEKKPIEAEEVADE